MKKSFSLNVLLCVIMAVLIPALSGAATPPAPKAPAAGKNAPGATIKPHKFTLNIMELTNAQNYRYGREMFLTGNYPEAVRTFKEILRLDCHNRLAQYHLMKIATNDPDFSYLMDEMKHMPCEAYNFAKEDFLPASIYYEKDTDILLEQILAYKKRLRLTEAEMKAEADKYNTLVAGLEARIANLTGDNPGGLPAAKQSALFAAEERAARKAEKYIIYLKDEVASDRLSRQKNLQDMRTRLSATENSISENEDDAAAKPQADPHSPKALSLMDAIQKAKSELESKETASAKKDIDLSSLQSRFDDILRRLKAIQKKITKN
ncbi:MAG: hypothetical protein WCI27_07810, partial [Candidatus Omnitrophota bacterium]